MKLEKNKFYKISEDAPFHKGACGVFIFMGGPSRNVAVLRIKQDMFVDTLISVCPKYLIG